MRLGSRSNPLETVGARLPRLIGNPSADDGAYSIGRGKRAPVCCLDTRARRLALRVDLALFALEGGWVDVAFAAVAVAGDARGLGGFGGHLVEHRELVGLVGELVVVAGFDVDELARIQN